MTEASTYRSMYPGFFQTAYVTNDLDVAVDRVGKAYGVKNWMRIAGFSFPVASGKDLSIDVAIANLGDTQFELIQPMGGDDAMYRDSMKGGSGFELVFHHFCKAFDTEEQFLAQRQALKDAGVFLPMDNSDLPANGVARACYGDFRDSLGHYLEYVWFTDAGREWVRAIPSND